MKVVRDLTPLLKRATERDRRDPRPWYQKSWPYLRKNQHVKIIPSYDGKLSGHQKALTNTAWTWRERAATVTPYRFKSKLLIIEESTACEDRQTQAKLVWLKDEEGNMLKVGEDNDKIRNGEYLLIYIEMFSPNWVGAIPERFEHSLVHELLHIVDPEKAFFMKNGRIYEDETLMEALTEDWIKKYRRKHS